MPKLKFNPDPDEVFERKPPGSAETLLGDSLIESLARRLVDLILDRLLPLLRRPTVEKRYLTIEEAAIYSGYSVGALQKHIQRGHLPVSKEGKSTRVDKLEIDEWMARNRE
jgi:excisionase family DNA binding protein